MFVGFPTLEHATYSCPCEAWITVLSYRSRNVFQKGRNRLRRSKKVYKHRGCQHRHTRDSQGGQHCVVILLAKHLARTTGKVEKVKECVVRRQGTEEGRTNVRYFYVIICMNAMQLQVDANTRQNKGYDALADDPVVYYDVISATLGELPLESRI